MALVDLIVRLIELSVYIMKAIFLFEVCQLKLYLVALIKSSNRHLALEMKSER